MDELNTFTDVQEPVVEAPETAEEVSETEETAEQNTAEPVQEPAPPVQTAEENRVFKERRIKAEQEKAATERILNEYRDAVRQYGYDPDTMSDADIVNSLIAQAQSKTPEQVKVEREAQNKIVKERMLHDPDYMDAKAKLEQYEREEQDRQFANDLTAIKQAFPDEKASSVYDFGREFFVMCSQGVAPMVAYTALREQKKASDKTPPSTGDVSGASTKEKDFYTSEEVDKLTDADYEKDPKLWGRVRKSMTKW